MKTLNDDIIRNTLTRLTSFKGEPPQSTSTHKISPTRMVFPETSDESSNSEEDQTMTLELAKSKLDWLMAKQRVAAREGDLVTASDLQFYAIPDVKFRINELTVKEIKAKKETQTAGLTQENKTEEATASAQNAAEVAQGFVLQRLDLKSAHENERGLGKNMEIGNAVLESQANETDQLRRPEAEKGGRSSTTSTSSTNEDAGEEK